MLSAMVYIEGIDYVGCVARRAYISLFLGSRLT